MNYKEWLRKIVEKYGAELKTIKCPFLDGRKCTIYEERMNCCRNFPKKIGKNKFCVGRDCKIVKLKVRKNTKKSSEICLKECKENCCEAILYPKNMPLKLNLFKKWMNMDCKTCIKAFKGERLNIKFLHED
jgi:hypothetical protein